MRYLVFARKEVLRVLGTKGIVPLSTKHGTKNLAPLAPWPPHQYLSKLGGGGGGGWGMSHTRTVPGHPAGSGPKGKTYYLCRTNHWMKKAVH